MNDTLEQLARDSIIRQAAVLGRGARAVRVPDGGVVYLVPDRSRSEVYEIRRPTKAPTRVAAPAARKAPETVPQCRYVEDEAVTPYERAVAYRATAMALGELGLYGVKVRFFRNPTHAETILMPSGTTKAAISNPTPVTGMAFPRDNTIWVMAEGRSLTALIETCAHECRHIASGPDARFDDYDEAAADAYGKSFVRRNIHRSSY